MEIEPERSRPSRERLLARLPPAGALGRSVFVTPGSSWPDGPPLDALHDVADASATGAIAFLLDDGEAMVVVPPFNVEEPRDVAVIDIAPLVELLHRRRTVAAFLLRKGGYTMGVFRDDFLVDSKTDRRFVKNRHRKGGQSQRRFDRIRDKQIHELYGMACEDLRDTFSAYEAEIQQIFLGGDRQALIGFRKECDYLDKTFGERIMARTLPVTSDPRRASLDGLPREIWSSDVYVLRDGPPSEDLGD